MSFTEKRLCNPTQLTTSGQTLYTVPASKTAIVKQIVVTNVTGSSATFSLFIGSAATPNALFSATSVAANDAIVINLSQVLNSTEILTALASANSTLNITISGVENDGPLNPLSTYIADGAITTDKIADSSVTSAKILDGTIINADINASAAIAATKILGTAVTASIFDAKGDLLAGTADNTLTRLAVGSNNRYLQANSAQVTGLEWSNNPVGLELIAEQSFSSSVITIDNCFSSTYQHYRIMAYGEHTGTAGGVTMWMQLRNGSGTNAQGYYSLTTYNTNSAGPTRDWQAYIGNGFWAGVFANLYGAISLDLLNPFVNGLTYFNAQSAGWGTSTGFQVVNSGFQYITNSYTGLYIYPNSGTTVNGTVRVYGYRNA